MVQKNVATVTKIQVTYNCPIEPNFLFHLSMKSTFNFRLIWRLTFEKCFTLNHVAKLNDA